MANRLDGVDPTVRAIVARLEGVASEGLLMRVQLCLSEALTNLVVHGNTDQKAVPVDVVLTMAGDQVVFEIFDPMGAEPFDPLDHARSLSEIDPMAEGGRGLALILECADRLDYGPSDRRNRLSIGFDLRDEDPGFGAANQTS